MQFSLYINLSENNKLEKRLTTEAVFSGSLIAETSIVNPVFLISGADISGFNYLYCSDFKRYYFINDIVSVRTSLWRISCSVDVLMSFSSYIKNLRAVVAAQENYSVGNSFLDDGTFVADNRVSTEVVNFPSGFTASEVYVLTTIGPGGIRTS